MLVSTARIIATISASLVALVSPATVCTMFLLTNGTTRQMLLR